MDMDQKPQHSVLWVGMRNFKTALAATLCALLYFPIKRNPTFACIGAIFGLGRDMRDSWVSGGNRFFGTMIGGFLAMLLFHIYVCIYPDGQTKALMLPLLFVGVILLIILCRLFKWPGGIQPGGVVLCIILFNTPVDTYITYCLNRIFDTGVGFVIALLINWLLPQKRVVHWMECAHLRKPLEK